MHKRLLDILHCPVTHKRLGIAKPSILQAVNAAIEAGRISNRDGQALTGPLAEALLTDDGKILYPVVDGIPVLLEGE
ncbi:MAG: hypothetical protein OEV69_15075, partial [Gammaproteobacteria bacterium]|nr:hypothetical protein [Gammaproteobacteria bacterium]